MGKLIRKIKEYLNTHKTVAEILRFLIVGAIATLVDMFIMGVVMYALESEIYSSFINVFIGKSSPSTSATIIGTTVGFIIGLSVNYILSIFFVFNDKGKSKTAKGFLIFAILSIIGLAINVVGTYIGYDLIGLNQWVIKIIMILIVLVYNYISKRMILFTSKKSDNSETSLNTESLDENLSTLSENDQSNNISKTNITNSNKKDEQ